nr:hypothetical protein [Tanacetum cinerariifolium]
MMMIVERGGVMVPVVVWTKGGVAAASDIWDRIDRSGRSIFGFGQKTRRKTFPAAAMVVAGGGGGRR